MLLFTILIQLSIITCNVNIAETVDKLKYISNNCKANRHRKCTNEVGNNMKNTLHFLERPETFGEYIKQYNVSQCQVDFNGVPSDYMKGHVLNRLLVKDYPSPESHWHEYKTLHNKVYPTRYHEMTALAQWRENMRRVARHNQQFLAGVLSYSLHLNHFGDLASTDYFKKILKLIDTKPLFDPAEDRHRTAYVKNLHRRVPRQVDWRAKGFKPRREEQWHCGACYAFAVTHALQAQVFKRHGDWRELSPQQIVDCSYRDGNVGCNGGSLRAAMRYVAREGLIKESYYPYIGKRGRCRSHRFLVRVRPRRWATLPAGDERAMERALATVGPLAVAVNASPFTFQLYRSGIYDDPFCVPWKLNHAMLLVGYTPHYWILLNWWGKNWGEDGYIRIRRGFNRCGVANMATYVEL